MSIQREPMTFERLRASVGQEIGVSDWTLIDQLRIDQFAACTGDRQWLHTDPSQARRRSPFRTTIAHGYLTLSIIGGLFQEMDVLPHDTQGAINQGLNEVRFHNAVKVGSRVRLRITLLAVEDVGPRQYLMRGRNTIEIEGEDVPALVAETLVMLYQRR